jgi:hypothetical protein
MSGNDADKNATKVTGAETWNDTHRPYTPQRHFKGVMH